MIVPHFAEFWRLFSLTTMHLREPTPLKLSIPNGENNVLSRGKQGTRCACGVVGREGEGGGGGGGGAAWVPLWEVPEKMQTGASQSASLMSFVPNFDLIVVRLIELGVSPPVN